MEHYSGISGVVYSFNNKNLVTFEDNLGYKDDLPVFAYIDFETTGPTDICFDPVQKKYLCRVLRYHTCYSSKTKIG